MECQTQRLKYCTGCEWCCLSQGGFDYPLTILWQAGANQYSLMRDWVDWRQHFRLEMKTCLLNAGLLHLSEYLSELLLIDRYQTPMIVFSVHEDHHSLHHTFRDFWLFFLSSIVSGEPCVSIVNKNANGSVLILILCLPSLLDFYLLTSKDILVVVTVKCDLYLSDKNTDIHRILW